MKTQWRLFFIALLLVGIGIGMGVAACSNPSNENHQTLSADTSNALAGKLIITGSSTIAPVTTELARLFESRFPATKIDVQTGGSSRGISDVRRSIADIGMVSRKLKNSEQEFQGHLFATDGISIIVHQSKSIENITTQQVRDIFQGKIRHWQQLTGDASPLTVIHKAEGRSTLEVFLNYFALKNPQIKADIIIGDNEQAIKLVANNPNAIAYVSIGAAEYAIMQGSTIKLLTLNGIVASTDNLLHERFPLRRELNFISRNDNNPLKKAFLDFTTSIDAQPIIKEFGFAPTLH